MMPLCLASSPQGQKEAFGEPLRSTSSPDQLLPRPTQPAAPAQPIPNTSPSHNASNYPDPSSLQPPTRTPTGDREGPNGIRPRRT